MKIYFIDWTTESGDEGIKGAWKKKPTPKQVDAYMREHFPYEFESWCGEHGGEGESCPKGTKCPGLEPNTTIYYNLEEMTVTESIQ